MNENKKLRENFIIPIKWNQQSGIYIIEIEELIFAEFQKTLIDGAAEI